MSNLLHLLGFSLLFMAFLTGLYFYLPLPGRQRNSDDEPKHSLEDWVKLADSAEHHPPGHAQRVAALALHLAEAMAFSEALRPKLELACLLHDIGVVGHDADLMARPGPLTAEEKQRLRQHALRGARRALEVTRDPDVAQWVRWRHEQWDGLGYPDGLVGQAIPLPCRILALADAAESMLSERPYRPARHRDDVISEIDQLAGLVFDPELTKIFVDYVIPRIFEPENVVDKDL